MEYGPSDRIWRSVNRLLEFIFANRQHGDGIGPQKLAQLVFGNPHVDNSHLFSPSEAM
jgi:hypothetical protein